MPIDNLSKITSRTGISTTILLEAGNVNATGIITAAGFNGPFTGGGAIAAGIITGTGLDVSGIATLGSGGSGQAILEYQGTTRLKTQSWGQQTHGILQNFGDIETVKFDSTSSRNLIFKNDSGGLRKVLEIGHASSNNFITGHVGNISINAPQVSISTNFSVGGISTFTGKVAIATVTSGGEHEDTHLFVYGGITFKELTAAAESNLPAITQFSQAGEQSLAIGARSSGGAVRFYSGNVSSGTADWATNLNAERFVIRHDGQAIFNNNLKADNNFEVAGISTFTGEVTTTGDVGIGTTNPHKRLHVADYGTHGAIRVEGSGNGNRSGIEFYRETSAGVSKGGAAIWVESDTSTSAGKLRFGTANNAAVQSQNTDMILDHQGRLGIGSTIPTSKLDIYESSGDGVRIRAGDQSADVALSVGSAGTPDKFVIQAGGKVGIGSIIPSTELDVEGDINFQDHMLIANMSSAGVGGSNIDHIWHSDAADPKAGGTWNFVSDGTAKQVGNSVIQAGYLKTSSGGSLFGSVGIGTTDPTTLLTLAKDENPTLTFLDYTNNAKSQILGSAGGQLVFQTDINSVNANSDFIFRADSVSNEIVRFKDSGEVGIGTDNPDAALHILSDANNTLQVESTDRHSTIYIIDSIGSSFIQNDSGELRFGVGGGASAAGGETEAVRIDSDGLVGVGTNNPSGRLNIVGTDSNILNIVQDTGDLSIRLNDRFSSSAYIKIPDGSGALTFETGGDESLRIDASGQVGIGTSTPAVRLDVRNDSGTSASTEPLVALHHSVNDVDGEVLRIGRTDIPTIRYHSLFSEHSGGASSNTLKFYMHDPARSVTSTRQVLTLQGNGRVGIGTTNGGLDAALEVCSDEGAFIKSFTNAQGAKVRFSDLATSGGYGQFMTIDYRHANNAVLDGTEEGLHIFGSEGVTAVRIDGLLRVTEQPCAVVYQATGPAGGSASGSSDNKEPIHFDHVHINQGGMAIANDNARITVPVPGNYLVSGMISGGVTNIDTNDGIELLFLVDGSEYPASNSGIEPVFNYGHGHNPSSNMAFVAHTEFFCSNTTILSLSENDYIELAVDNIGSADATINRGHLSVSLLN